MITVPAESPMRLKLDDFPDSPYARELRRGTDGLRFEGPLEAEYRLSHLRNARLRVRSWFALTTLLTVLLTIEDVRRNAVGSAFFLLRMTALIPSSVALAWLAWSRQYQRYYLPAAGVLVSILCGVIAVFVAQALLDGRTEMLAGLAVNVIAAFFFCGLLFRQALVTCVVTITMFAAAASTMHVPGFLLLKSVIILTVTTVIGAIVSRDAEQTSRRSFLEGALITQLAAGDGLTGLMNRRAFDEHLARVWQHALRDQRSIAILMIDIDHFKRYNDTFGHQAGDRALRGVAEVVQGFARRPLDLAARYGGEEFAVILYGLAPTFVNDMAERLRQNVQELPIPSVDAGETAGRAVTISVGVGVAAPTAGRTPQGAVQLADEALYEAKQAGRNRVAVKGLDAYRLLKTGDFKSPRGFRR